MLAGPDVTALHRRWHTLAHAVVASLPLIGIDKRDVVVSGMPPRIAMGTWGEIILAEGPGHPRVLIRAQMSGKGLLTANLDASDTDVVTDILDCIACLLHRRLRHLDQDRLAIEAELADMASSTGWTCDGVGGRQPSAAFSLGDEGIRGRVVRADRADGDPSRATFSVVAEVGGVGYAQALAVLAGLRQAFAEQHPTRSVHRHSVVTAAA